jgi:hypothetical protein
MTSLKNKIQLDATYYFIMRKHNKHNKVISGI